MKKTTWILNISFILLIQISCGVSESETSQISEENNLIVNSNSNGPNSSENDLSTPSLTGKFAFEVENGEYGPISTIKVITDGEEYFVEEISGSANLIDKFEYEEMEIPGDAISACGAWWAGGGDYFYLRVSSDQLIIYAGWLDEMAPEKEGYHWEERMRIPE